MNYAAKILLFGEYGIILNSMALAIPYPRFWGQFRFSNALSDNNSKTECESNIELKKLLTFFKTQTSKVRYINIELFENEINQGLYFDSSVPVGSGLGSSAALTAAIYERYLIQPHQIDYLLIKKELGAIESCFHGKSSGFDPLVSLLKKPVMMDRNSSIITEIDLTPFLNKYTLFLIDTHSKGNTGELVNNFMKNYNRPDFKTVIDNEYIPIVNQVVKAVIESDFVSFDKFIVRYSEIQLSFFDTMIPQSMKSHFEYGITSGEFYLKICGSGGGGYILGFARERVKAESYFNLNHLDWMVV
ncbi:MAG TPA: hypothetical protein VGK38_03565 [Prolixibacteraceae bacterium]|jgi:mevalonate kinase